MTYLSFLIALLQSILTFSGSDLESWLIEGFLPFLHEASCTLQALHCLAFAWEIRLFSNMKIIPNKSSLNILFGKNKIDYYF